MTNKTIESIREVGGDYFRFYYSRKGGKNLQFYLDKFNPDEYYIYKSTNRFKEVSYDYLLEFKYAGYIFFKKDLYNNEVIENWIEFLYKVDKSEFKYLIKPFPPFNPQDKIKIKK